MKTSPSRFMRGLSALLGCAFLTLMLCAPARGVTMPLTVSLDMPNQVTAAPSSGTTILTFSGTVTIDPAWTPQGANFDFPFNSAMTNSLTGSFNSAFLAFFLPGTSNGTYTGAIFTINVPTGTPTGLYAFDSLGGPSELILQVAEKTMAPMYLESRPAFDGTGNTTFNVMTPFSIQVTNGTSVPDGGSTIVLLGSALGALGLIRHARPAWARSS